MQNTHDPAALVHHAAQAGDWRLVDLVTRVLIGRASVPSTVAHRAYATLVLKLGLAGDGADYHRA